MIHLRDVNYKQIRELKYRKASVERWKDQHNDVTLTNKNEKMALVNVVLDHFCEYISAYETKDVERIVESSIRHIAICKVAIEMLSGTNYSEYEELL